MDQSVNVILCPNEENAPEIPKTLFKKIHEKVRIYKWSNVILLSTIHILFVYAMYYLMVHPVKLYTFLFSGATGFCSGMGMTVGAHRLWAHRSFKARLPLRIMLAISNSMTMNGSAFSYARDHRTHHKYSDTEGDPKNPSRGLFYSHIGWWMLKKTQKVIEHGNKLDFSDLRNDPVVWFQHKFYVPMFLLFGVALPTLIPYYIFGENLATAFLLCVAVRLVVVLHHLFTVNSLAHFFGHRPYDFRIRPTENRLVVYLSIGEGNHNYHHTFPYDYASTEKKFWEFYNPSTLIIDTCVLLGLAYDCKKASREAIEGAIKRKGVPAYFDEPLPLPLRILNGIFDWIIGGLMIGWVMIPVVAYKYFTHQPIFLY